MIKLIPYNDCCVCLPQMMKRMTEVSIKSMRTWNPKWSMDEVSILSNYPTIPFKQLIGIFPIQLSPSVYCSAVNNNFCLIDADADWYSVGVWLLWQVNQLHNIPKCYCNEKPTDWHKTAVWVEKKELWLTSSSL